MNKTNSKTPAKENVAQKSSDTKKYEKVLTPAMKSVAKPPKTMKEKPFSKNQVDVDVKQYVQKHGKLPGTGKRDVITEWKFDIGGVPFSVKTPLFRTAKAKAIEKAVELKQAKVVVLAA